MKGLNFLGAACPAGEMGNKLEIGGSAAASQGWGVGWVLCILQGETGWYYIGVLISQSEHIPHIMAWGGINWWWTGGGGRKRGNQGRGEVARHQTLSRLGERCCWEISRWEETNWKFVGAGMYILGSVLSGLTLWQSFWEEEQMVLRQGRGKQFWENSNEQSVDERRQEMRSAGRRDIMSYRWRGQTGSCD